MIEKQQIIFFGFIISLFGISLTGMVISPVQRQAHENFKQVIQDILIKEQGLISDMAENSPLMQRCMVLHSKLMNLNLQGIHFPMQLDVIKTISQSCAICRRMFEEDDIIIFSDLDTRCPHLYHSDCIVHAQQYNHAYCNSCSKEITYAPRKLLLVDMKVGQQELEPLYQKLVVRHCDMGNQEGLVALRQNMSELTALISAASFLMFKHAGWSIGHATEFIFYQMFLVLLADWSFISIDRLLYERPDLLTIRDPLLLIIFLTIICFNTYDQFFPGSELIIGTFLLGIIGQAALLMARFTPTVIEHFKKLYWSSCIEYFNDPAYFALFPIKQQFMEQCHRFIEAIRVGH